MNSPIGYITPKDMLVGHQHQIQVERDRAYVHALRDAQVTSDPRGGPGATYDWLPGVHARQLQRLAQRSECNVTTG